MKVNVTNVSRLRRDAYDCRYSHMVMEPTQIMDLCDEIMKLRTKVTELGGDPFNLDPLPPPAGTASPAPALDDPAYYPEGHKVAQDYMQRKSDEREALGDEEPIEKEPATKIVALLSTQGTACAETALYGAEDTPEARADVEAKIDPTDTDAPVPGSWTDVSDNEALQRT